MPFEDGVATPDEIREFCNDVRRAGGVEPLDALMPSEPANAESCLIARNLNFECEVNTSRSGQGKSLWEMTIEENVPLSENPGLAIASALGLEVRSKYEVDDVNGEPVSIVSIWLPEHIGNAAKAFDRLDHRFNEFNQNSFDVINA